MARSRVKEINRLCHSKSAAARASRSARRTHIDGREDPTRSRLYTRIVSDDVAQEETESRAYLYYR